jgi:hypothetical protein
MCVVGVCIPVEHVAMCGTCCVGLTVNDIVDLQVLCLHICIVCEGALVCGYVEEDILSLLSLAFCSFTNLLLHLYINVKVIFYIHSPSRPLCQFAQSGFGAHLVFCSFVR